MGEENQEAPPLMQRISDSVNRSIDFLSNTVAKYRGLPMILAFLLIVLNFLIVILGSIATIPALGFLVSTNFCLHLGLIIGFVGILLAEPLGRG